MRLKQEKKEKINKKKSQKEYLKAKASRLDF